MSSAHREWLTDEEQLSLVGRLLAGDADAETELVRMFTGRLRIMIAARTRDEEVARDLAQEALLHALIAVRAGRLREPDRLAAFVYGVGRNVVNNYLRRRRDTPGEIPLDPEMSLAPPVDVDAAEQQRRELAERALGVLGTIDRQILSLTLMDGLKPGAIADRLGLGVEVVRTRKSRALKKVVAEVARLSRSAARGH